MGFEDSNDDDNDDDIDDSGPLEVIVPTAEQWREAAYLQLKPYDTERKMQIEGPHRLLLIPLLGTTRHYSVELIYKDGRWDFLYFGIDLDEAKRLIQRLAAEHDLPIEKKYPKQSDVVGY